MEMAKVIGMQL